MELNIVRLDDWEAYYKDGLLLWEGHSIDSLELIHLLGIEYKLEYGNQTIRGGSVNEDYYRNGHRFPTCVDNVERMPRRIGKAVI